MPIGQIKALSWFVAALLTLGLSAYVYTFITELKEREKVGIVDQAEIKAALEDVPAIAEQTDNMIEYEDVRALFHEGRLNWTGYVPPEPITIDPRDVEPAKPKYTPVAELLRVLMIRYDPVDETHSLVFVRYTAEARVPPAAVVGGYSLHVGDPLHSPHDHIKVKSVGLDEETGRLSVTFEFGDEGREPESLGPAVFQSAGMIVQVGADGVRIPAPRRFPVSTHQRPRRGMTIQIAPNDYRLGTQDIKTFIDDYPSIINEVRPKKHRDPRTGRYDGIEISDVPAGSMAARHGAETGDIIKSINGHAVTSPSEAINYAKNNEADTWVIVIERRGKEQTINYTPD